MPTFLSPTNASRSAGAIRIGSRSGLESLGAKAQPSSSRSRSTQAPQRAKRRVPGPTVMIERLPYSTLDGECDPLVDEFI